MHLSHLSIGDFRSYPHAEVPLRPGVTTFIGLNGQGKTNLVEAAGYLASLGSHRAPNDAPLVRYGAPQAIVRGMVVRDGRETLVELEITPGRSNRARLNRSPVPRPRDVLGSLRTVLFAPEDLALVKGDPSERRRFLDDLLVARQPRWAGVRSDYDKALKQRNALLKSAAPVLRRGSSSRGGAGGGARTRDGLPVEDARASALHTLDIWNAQLAEIGAALVYARLRLLRDLVPYLTHAYDEVSAGKSRAWAAYRCSVHEQVAERITDGAVPEQAELREALLATFAQVREKEFERGVTLVGPHRDDVVLTLGELPARGYASHGESWSFALALRLAAYQLLRHDLGTDPVLVLDDVFAELDVGRRERLAALVADGEQVLITAAVPEDVPAALRDVGATWEVTLGSLREVDGPATTERGGLGVAPGEVAARSVAPDVAPPDAAPDGRAEPAEDAS
ncbi:MAG TPA: DNA replication/repair protein RecF [Segeticoccus sp.]|uniref:DNA replication/repair protein RecF n=1 Tax=Segeticoccus sp. TaxID=2706531 RepID=UPI002D7F53B2|nr:DNA replication/repair protein RecF [Segeticoccus sp.]HET8600955.1 DNA replication/repair protein RecF [Segeticoccus sp.]